MSGDTGPRSTGYHHGHHSRAFVVGMPYPFYAPTCDPWLDPYCNPHALVGQDEDSEDDKLLLAMPYYALEFLPDSDPVRDVLFEDTSIGRDVLKL